MTDGSVIDPCGCTPLERPETDFASGTELVRWNSERPSEELLPRFTSRAGSEIPLTCVCLHPTPAVLAFCRRDCNLC